MPLGDMAKDFFHDTVKLALQKDGWIITHEQYPLKYGTSEIYVDLAAEEPIAAEKEGRKIAVEVKSFIKGSTVSEFHTALGQFLNYRTAIEISEEPERILYLAVPVEIYDTFLKFAPAKTNVDRYGVRLVTYDPIREKINQWIE